MYTLYFLINLLFVISIFSNPLPLEPLFRSTGDNSTNLSSNANDSEYADLLTDNTTDYIDELNVTYSRSIAEEIHNILLITLPTAVIFSLLLLLLCLLLRPGTHFINHFVRPKYAVCPHQAKTREAVRRKYASTEEEREMQKLMEQARLEDKIRRIKEKRKRAEEKKIEAKRRKSEKQEKARLKKYEQQKALHDKKFAKIKKSREKDIKKKSKKEGKMEEKWEYLLDREKRERQFCVDKELSRRPAGSSEIHYPITRRAGDVGRMRVKGPPKDRPNRY